MMRESAKSVECAVCGALSADYFTVGVYRAQAPDFETRVCVCCIRALAIRLMDAGVQAMSDED